MRVFLIGFMGSGKSHNGRRSAGALQYDFIDLDAYIVQKAGKSIPQIFADYGERYFRVLEANTLKEMNQFEDVVISTGGGTPCFFDNMKWIKANGFSLFLNPTMDLLLHRLSYQTAKRPLLAGKSRTELQQFLQTKLQERLQFYQQADVTIHQDSPYGNNVKAILGAVTNKQI